MNCYRVMALLCWTFVLHHVFCQLNRNSFESTTLMDGQTGKQLQRKPQYFQPEGQGHNGGDGQGYNGGTTYFHKLHPGDMKAHDKTPQKETNSVREFKEKVSPQASFHLQKRSSRQTRYKRETNYLQECLPNSWQHMCSATFKLVSGSNFTSQSAVFVSCDLKQDDHWSLQTYRRWISANENQVYKALQIEKDLLFAFEFKCENKNASVSLPWPIRAKHLWFVSVFNCTILDYLAEYNNESDFPDSLKVMEIVNSELKIDSKTFFEVLNNYENVSRQYDCGGEQLEKYVFKNCTDYFTGVQQDEKGFLEDIEMGQEITTAEKRETMLQFGTSANNDENRAAQSSIPHVEKQMLDTIAKFGQDHTKVEHHCMYKHLTYIDQSYSQSAARHHRYFETDRSQYPVLQIYNQSHSKISQLSPMFLEWRRYFPRMQYLDLSYNKVKYFSTLTDNGLQNDTVGVLDLRHNNITTLTSEDIQALKVHNNTVFVDIRDNPLHCDCKLTHFVKTLKNASSQLLQKYEYLIYLSCASPKEFKGKIISELDENFCESLEVEIFATPMAVLGTFVTLLLVLLVLTIKCRKEIMILAFTRLHISLPCRKLTKYENKNYDAFIAYSENDGPWVIKTLLPRLEMPLENDGPGLKLCIHHRDFPIGGSIAENILEKVKESRHTVLILSNNFLLSNWCRYEFKTAFSQSLMEKKRHLIMIIKEELDKHLIDPDLNRCLKTFTFVKADDRLFWDKILYALNDRVRPNKRETENVIEFQRDAAEDINRNQAAPVHMINVHDEHNDENGNIQDQLKNGGRNQNPGFKVDGIWNV